MCKEGLLTLRLKDTTTGQRGMGRLKKTLEKTLRKDLEYLDLMEDMTQNRAQWCSRIHIADPTQWEKSEMTKLPSHVVHMVSLNRNMDGMFEKLTV
ncbi:hypothetical protein DVH24_035219 [Malus domestica]|uniref:Uncharacterized protein n=1 Tax=Malus domestica TaxID=3750 RepID=A0A498J6S3_MALDO|nr:hypothetical protein DVH24_035219 [Malus domestica]